MLSALQQDAPAHSYLQTRRQVEAAFRRPLEDVFEEFDEKPVASASIAQVQVLELVSCPRSTVKSCSSRSRHYPEVLFGLALLCWYLVC